MGTSGSLSGLWPWSTRKWYAEAGDYGPNEDAATVGYSDIRMCQPVVFDCASDTDLHLVMFKRETISLPFLPAFLMTSFFLAFTPILSVVLRIGWLRRLVQKCLPAGGTGPSRQQLESGHFQLQFVATAETEPYDEPVRAKGTVKGKWPSYTYPSIGLFSHWFGMVILVSIGFRDPGYGDTCRMVVESALCIIKSYDQLPGKDGGVLTSSTAFGHVLIDRLTKDGGMVFEVKDMQ